MKTVFEEYGGIILTAIVSMACLILFCSVWFGANADINTNHGRLNFKSLLSQAATSVFNASNYSKYTIVLDSNGNPVCDANGNIKIQRINTDGTDSKSTSDTGMMLLKRSDQTYTIQKYICNKCRGDIDLKTMTCKNCGAHQTGKLRCIEIVRYFDIGDYLTLRKQQTASNVEDIQSRSEARLYGAGYQNSVTQLYINTIYKSTPTFTVTHIIPGDEETIIPSVPGLIYAIDADNTLITALSTDSTINSSDTSNPNCGYIQLLSISEGNGNVLISDLARAKDKNIAFKDEAYDNKIGGSGAGSYASADCFNIETPDGDNWFTYNVKTNSWIFYKAGTYCLRVYVCDAKGKSMTGTVYINVAKNKTQNDGDGTNEDGH